MGQPFFDLWSFAVFAVFAVVFMGIEVLRTWMQSYHGLI